MSAVPFRSPHTTEKRVGNATVDLLGNQNIPDWCNRCGRSFTWNNHGWLRPLTPNGEPDRLGRLRYESICQNCSMPRLYTAGGKLVQV